MCKCQTILNFATPLITSAIHTLTIQTKYSRKASFSSNAYHPSTDFGILQTARWMENSLYVCISRDITSCHLKARSFSLKLTCQRDAIHVKDTIVLTRPRASLVLFWFLASFNLRPDSLKTYRNKDNQGKYQVLKCTFRNKASSLSPDGYYEPVLWNCGEQQGQIL